MSDKLSYRIDEAVKATGLSRSSLYRVIARGDLKTFKVGTMTLIMADALQAFLERQSHSQAA